MAVAADKRARKAARRRAREQFALARDGRLWAAPGYLSDPKVKPEPESVVALRVVVKANLFTASVNGVEVKKQRVQLPSSPPAPPPQASAGRFPPAWPCSMVCSDG
jgi:hypothetical protein